MSDKKKYAPNSVHKIAIINKTKGTQTRIVINEFEEKTSIDIRQWYKKATMEKFAPTAKGISVPVEELPSLYKAIKKAMKVAKEEDLL